MWGGVAMAQKTFSRKCCSSAFFSPSPPATALLQVVIDVLRSIIAKFSEANCIKLKVPVA